MWKNYVKLQKIYSIGNQTKIKTNEKKVLNEKKN